MYIIGDLILHGNAGVCRITDITTRDFSGADKDQLYYTVKPLYQDGTIFTPVNNTKVFMRPIISKDEAERLIDMIPSIHAEAYHSHVMRQVAEHYEVSLKTHNCEDLLELTMSIYEKKQIVEQQKRKLGSMDERFMKRAEALLFGELAAAIGIPKDKVPEYIAARVDGKLQRSYLPA